MPKASPSRHNFNAGVFSPLMYGRVDHDKYAFGMRELHNCVAVAQGPAIARSGTKFIQKGRSDSVVSALVPFVFSETQSLMLEFSAQRMRMHAEGGVVTWGNNVVTAVTDKLPYLIITSAALISSLITAGSPLAVNDYAYLGGFPGAYNATGRILKVINIAGNDITLDWNGYQGPIGAAPGTAIVAKVYELTTPYPSSHVRNLRWVQDIDVLYLFCKAETGGTGYPPQKLSRFDALEWTIEDVAFEDGPYLSEPVNSQKPAKLTPNGTGEATEAHTTNIGANGTASASSASADAWKAFSQNPELYWAGTDIQGGTLIYQFNSAQVIEGYVVYNMPQIDPGAGSSITPTDRRPRAWTFRGSNNGINWTTLDEQRDYALWTNNRTQYINIKNSTAYTYYSIKITALESGGSFVPWIQALVMRKATPPSVTLTANNRNAINNKKGFLATDVGRFIRLFQGDGCWHAAKIVAYNSATSVDVQPWGEPLYSTRPVTRWRLGAFSSSTGYPTNAAFGFDRLWMTGVRDFPTDVYASTPSNYEDMSPSDMTGAVTANNGILARPKLRNASPVGWMLFTGRGMALGYGSGEMVLSSATESDAFAARNMKVLPATKRGSAFVSPVQVDSEVVYVTKDKKSLREFAYVFQADGYKSPSMQVFASHLGNRKFAQIVYQQDPHSIVWCRMEDGSLVGFTYNREENVLGWHTHSLGVSENETHVMTAFVEYIQVKPNDDGTSDELWLMVKRTSTSKADGTFTINRYIEKLEPFWTFGQSVNDAFYVDCGVKGTIDPPSDTITGLWHLEGMRVHGIADGIAFGYEQPVFVTNGTIQLSTVASNVTVGFDMPAYGETTDIQAGAADGTSKGKSGRINNLTVEVWDTAGDTEVGTWNDELGGIGWTPITQYQDLDTTTLHTKQLDTVLPEPDYNKRRTVAFRRTRPYPMNIVGIYPQLNVNDR